jgi:acyl carrier protein
MYEEERNMEAMIYKMLEEVKPECDFKDSTDFIEDGLLDSFDVISLISLIEETCGITIDGLDVVPENFASAEAIEKMIVKNGGSV